MDDLSDELDEEEAASGADVPPDLISAILAATSARRDR